MTADEAKRILFEKPMDVWAAVDVAQLVEELARLERLVAMYQSDAYRRYGKPQVYTSGGTSVKALDGYQVFQADPEQAETWEELKTELDNERRAVGARLLFPDE